MTTTLTHSRAEYMAFCKFSIDAKNDPSNELCWMSFKAGVEYMKRLIREKESIEKLSIVTEVKP